MKFLLAIFLIVLWTAPREEKVFFLPTANAGADITIPTGSQALLNGINSTGTSLSYQWNKISGPTGDSIYLANMAQAIAGRLTVTGTYKYELVVTDNASNISRDTVQITTSVSPTKRRPTAGLTIKQIGPAEYHTTNIASNDTAYRIVFDGVIAMDAITGFIGKPVMIASGQYDEPVITDLGYAFWLPHSNYPVVPQWIDLDINGNLFDSLNYLIGYLHEWFFIKASDGSAWMWGNDRYNWYAGVFQGKARPLPMPAGKQFKAYAVSEGGLLALTTVGDIYQYKPNSTTPVLITNPTGRPAIAIASTRTKGYMALIPDAGQPTTSGIPYCWGDTRYVGGTNGSIANPTDFRSFWGNRPFKFVWTSDESIHCIDTAGQCFGAGNNGGGEVGDSTEWCNHGELYSPPYAWNWLAGIFVSPAKNITPAGHTFKIGWGPTVFGFGNAAQDEQDSIWTWGRDKSFEQQTWIQMSDGGNARPNMLDRLFPFRHSVLWGTLVTIPVTIYTCNAGANQSISVTSTTLNGAATPTAGYSFTGYKWTQLSGPNTGTFGSSTALTTTFTGLITGTYSLKLLATDNNTATIADTLQVIVNATTPPVVSILPSPATITEPASSVSLSGSATTSGGATITSWLWFRRSGNTVYNITSPTSQNTTITGLQPGTYVFELDATDSNGNTGTTQVTVNVLRYPDKIIIRKKSFHHKIIIQ